MSRKRRKQKKVGKRRKSTSGSEGVLESDGTLGEVVPVEEEGRRVSLTRPHLPVLLSQVVELFAEPRLIRVVDGTLGAGGHSEGLLDRYSEMRVLGVDRDTRAIQIAKGHLARFGDRFSVWEGTFSTIEEGIRSIGWKAIDGLLLDIGVSSMQLDQAAYGMSFQTESPLDMRMGTSGMTAAEFMASASEEELADVIFRFGEERLSRRIASRIKSAFDDGAMNSTFDLARACISAYPKGYHRIHPATRTFQAIRIQVNDELGELTRVLNLVPRVMAKGGRLAVISFHSLEDRLVKQQFRSWADEGLGRILTKKPVTADEAEARDNPRSRSAKLRGFEWGVLAKKSGKSWERG